MTENPADILHFGASSAERAPLEGEEEVRETLALTFRNQGHRHQGPAPSQPPRHGHHTVNMGGALDSPPEVFSVK